MTSSVVMSLKSVKGCINKQRTAVPKLLTTGQAEICKAKKIEGGVNFKRPPPPNTHTVHILRASRILKERFKNI